MGESIGHGGEGSIYKIIGTPDKVAKIYKAEILADSQNRTERERKLKAMIGMNIEPVVGNILRLAWPVDVLYSHGQMVGFVMPKISKKLKIFDIQRCWRAEPSNPCTQAVLSVYPGYTWKYSVQFAYNLAWVVFYVHSKGIVIGDLNQNNVYADTTTGAVVLIDCDSFDITDRKTGERFPCKVGWPEILAPELQTDGELKGRFTIYTDEFSLAIHIFRLLMRNADPFGGVPSEGASSSALTIGNPNIKNGNCPYVRKCKLSVPAWAPDISILPLNVQKLFDKTFNYNADTAPLKIKNRATALEWCRALEPLGAREPNVNLKKCTNKGNPHYKYHVYAAHNASCPWCKCEAAALPLPISQTSKVNQARSTANQAQNTANQTQKTAYQVQRTATQIINTVNPAAQSPAIVKKNSPIVRRTPNQFYMVWIACGIAGGFAFQVFGGLYSTGAAILLALVGGVVGAIIAHHFKEKYIYADNAVPWLCSGALALFIAPAVLLALNMVVFVTKWIILISLFLVVLKSLFS